MVLDRRLSETTLRPAACQLRFDETSRTLESPKASGTALRVMDRELVHAVPTTRLPCQLPCRRPLKTLETGAMPPAMPKLTVWSGLGAHEIPREIAISLEIWRARQELNLRPPA